MLWSPRAFRRQIGKVVECEAGETLVCREHGVQTRIKFNCNYEYLILEVKANELVIKGAGGGPLVVSVETVRKKFILNYCRTCHSLHGVSGAKDITDQLLERYSQQKI